MKKFSHTDKNLTIFLGTDIPPMSTKESFIYAKFADNLDVESLHFDDIKKDFTYNKKDLFDKLSYMSKRKIIEKINKHYYKLIPKISFNECSECRVYSKLNKRERLKLIKDFS